jgi:hypothetical protein
MTLNKKQQEAFNKVIEFINNPNEKFMNVSGGAGTGKTYFISQIAQNILKYKDAKSTLNYVAITATTNKAVAVIAQSIPNDPVTTYSFMNLKVSENFTTGEQKLIPTRNWVVYSNVFLIVDECSMVNKKLFDYICNGLDNSCKVLFVGDMNQLTPVKEDISPVYKNYFRTVLLTEQMRNSTQPALMNLCEQVKQTVITGVFTPIIEVPGVIDFVKGSILRGILEREYCIADPNKRILSYTNQKVIQYNQFVRELRGYTLPFEPGEIIYNNEPVEINSTVNLYTDQILQIKRIISNNINNKIISGQDIPTITLEVEDVMTKTIYMVLVFENPEDRINVLRYYSSRKDWINYFKIKNKTADFRPVAASTTHKAQGSTYDSVIVDLEDIGKCTNKNQTARLQYVALSRAKNRIFIKGQLPMRYFND